MRNYKGWCKMNIQFKPEQSVYKELEMYLGYRYKNQMPYTEEYIEREYIGSVDEAKEIFSRVLSLHQRIEDYGVIVDSDYELFFMPFGPKKSTHLGSFIFEDDTQSYAEVTWIESFNEQLGTEFDNREEILNYVMASEELDAESRYRFLLLLQNYDSISSRFRNYMENYRSLIDELNLLLPEYNKKFEETMDLKDLIALIRNFIPDIDQSETMIVTPYMLSIDHIRVQMKKVSFEEVEISASLEMLSLDKLSSNTESLEKQFQDGIKALAEPMKYAALKLCLNEEKYGSQLAEELGISGATVSHHMQVLVNLGYVFTQINNKRVYYRTNKEGIEKDLKLFNKLFEQ